jgi:hypothetical protein
MDRDLAWVTKARRRTRRKIKRSRLHRASIKAAANLASEIMPSLTDVPQIGALPEHRPARSRFIDRPDRRHLAVPLRKNQAPDFSEARPIRRGVHPPPAIIFYIATMIAAVKLLAA